MLFDLIRAACAALAAAVLPGYFWAVLLRPAGGLAERLAYSTALSMAAVPAVALVLIHLANSGLTLWIAIVAPVTVLISGLAAVRVAGAATGTADPILPGPQAISDPRALAVLALAFLAALLSVVPVLASAWLVLGVLALLVLAAVLAGLAAPAAPEVARPTRHRTPGQWPRLRGPVLAAVLVAIAVRAYEPAIRYDWPSVRGADHFSHAAMAEQVLAHGGYPTYLIYPPGLPALSAVLSRLSGLEPLALYAVLAPSLLVLTALGAYALAARLWGPDTGIAAAALSGLVLHGAYGGLIDGRYPDLVSAYFLITMAVAALLTLYQSPSVRSAALAAVIGATPVLYHQVATLYTALIVVLAVVTALPYLWWRGQRREAGLVLLALTGLVLIATCYAWYTYGLGWPLVHHAASSDAVSMVLGTQTPSTPIHVLTELAPPIVWLGLLGVVLLALSLRGRLTSAQWLAVVTLLAWCALMYLGSRTAADGFPQRFERDLGAPLSVAAAFGLAVLGASLWAAWQRTQSRPAAAGALVLALATVLAIGTTTVQMVQSEWRPTRRLPNRAVLAAGAWLWQHNTGGTIVATGINAHLTERAVLAMGGYPGLMYYGRGPSTGARSLPPAGLRPLIESQEVLEYPGSREAEQAINREDIRYIFLYLGNSQDFDLGGFRADPARYRQVFQNAAVVIFATMLHSPGSA